MSDEVAYLRQQLADAQTLARQYAAGHAEWYLKHGPHIENEGERIAWGEVAERDATIAALREQLRYFGGASLPLNAHDTPAETTPIIAPWAGSLPVSASHDTTAMAEPIISS